jgi:protein-tyrosine kinase
VGRVEEALRRSQTWLSTPEPASRDFRVPPEWLAADEIRPTVAGPEPVNGSAASPGGPAVEPRPLLPDRVWHVVADEWSERLALGPNASPVFAEVFRKLAATLHHAQNTNGLKSVLVTSASPTDGKSVAAVNLAVVLSESYRKRVLLIDGDMRRPALGQVFRLTQSNGLAEALSAKADPRLTLVSVTPTLTVLPAGRPLPDPVTGLSSARMTQLVEDVVARFDWVIVDAPPVGAIADATLLAQMVDGTLLVIRSGKTQYPEVRQAIDAIGRERLLGVVLNDVARLPNHTYLDYYADEEATADAAR